MVGGTYYKILRCFLGSLDGSEWSEYTTEGATRQTTLGITCVCQVLTGLPVLAPWQSETVHNENLGRATHTLGSSFGELVVTSQLSTSMGGFRTRTSATGIGRIGTTRTPTTPSCNSETESGTHATNNVEMASRGSSRLEQQQSPNL